MSMMHSTTVLIILMAALILIAAGAFVAVRLYGAREVKDDHPS